LVRAFGGRSSFTTYLTVVIHNLLRDFRNQRLGKWRPTAAARRLGEVGVLLDTLLHRDRRSLDVAIEILRRNHGVTLSPAVLASMATTLPPHYPRRIEGDHDLDQQAATERTDQRLIDGEQARIAEQTERALNHALEALDPEEKLLLKLRYHEGFRVSQIARRLQRDPQALYRTFDQLLVVLRGRLEAAGLTASAVIGILGADARGGDASQPRSSADKVHPESGVTRE
jgi:RNA polymerase sigma factor (sigma-70 family)